MESVREHFVSALRRVPGIVVGVSDTDRLEVTALGTLEHEPDPASLCWEIGSITKVFTGVLLAEMSIRGEVGLNDPIGLHLPDSVAARLPADALQPTLTDLATHTAGFPRLPLAIIRLAKGSDDPYSKLTKDDVLAYLGQRTKRPRRRRSRYSNYGMGLLGQLLAGVAGMPYSMLIEERLLSPLGMTATGLGNCGNGTNPVQGFRKGAPTPPWTFGALEGAGALRSTVNDLVTFARGCLDPPDGTIVESLELARRPFYRSRRQIDDKGLGWMLRSRARHKRPTETIWHNGGTFGASSFLAIDVLKKRAVIALGNAGPRVIPPLDSPSWAVFDSLSGQDG
jgi:CubicO group peptidase (beta-lactamase class C family)